MRKKPRPPLPPLEELKETTMGLEIRILSNLAMRIMDKRGGKEKIDAATGSNGWIVCFLADAERDGKDIYQKDIEEKFCITRSTVSKVLSLMEQKGFIERRNVKGDARLKKIVMTDKARELHNIMVGDAMMLDGIIQKGFTEEEINTFYMLSKKIRANLKEALDQ